MGDGLTPEERVKEGKRLGEADATDFENPYVRFSFLLVSILYLFPVRSLMGD